jgi:cytochrome c-type biogenesis protein CcmH
MTLLWLLGAALAAAVLAWLLRPLLFGRHSAVPSRSDANVSIYRDQMRELEADLAAGTLAREDYERARAELEARLLQDVAQPDPHPIPGPAARGGRRAAWALGAAVPVIGLAVYLAVGSPGAIDLPPEPPQGQQHASAAQVAAMVERLAARLRENPDDADGWRLLGRSYSVMGRFDDAADAYAKAAARAPRDAALLADFADVLAMARGRSLQGEPEQLALRALEIEPSNLKALALAGTAAFERKDYARAAAHWERMLPHVAPDSDDARAIQRNVAEARALSNQKIERTEKTEKKSSVAVAALRGTVSLSPKVKDKASPEDTVFVFARAAEGPPMPLAVARLRVRDLPYRFSLDDSMAMTPQLKLSAFPKVVVTARVSKTGNATAQPGDLQGASAPVSNSAAAVAVVIDGFVR